MRVLNIESSPRGETSVSIAVAQAFLAAYREFAPALVVDTLNVWDEALPEFDRRSIGAKYKGVSGEPMDDGEAGIWGRIQSLVRRFQDADRIVVGVPMWNFAYPYKLKQLVDLVSQRNMLFTFDGTTFGPKLHTPRALAIYTRGQSYTDGGPLTAAAYDHQTAYIEFWLTFIGVATVDALVVEHTWDDKAADHIERAKQAAADLARRF